MIMRTKISQSTPKEMYLPFSRSALNLPNLNIVLNTMKTTAALCSMLTRCCASIVTALGSILLTKFYISSSLLAVDSYILATEFFNLANFSPNHEDLCSSAFSPGGLNSADTRPPPAYSLSDSMSKSIWLTSVLLSCIIIKFILL